MSNVSATNDDASICKLSAVMVGYYQDEYLKFFVKKPSRKPPLMNRGYYSRVMSIKMLINQFLEAGGQQIISLGAGFDTSFFHLAKKGTKLSGYFEIDLPSVISKKVNIIKKNSELCSLVSMNLNSDNSNNENSVVYTAFSIDGPTYHLLSADLLDVQNLEKSLLSAGLDLTKPSLVISECVLVYITGEASNRVLSWFISAFSTNTPIAFILYEQIHPNDAFGQVMIRNLQTRGCPIVGIYDFPDLESQKRRFLNLGCDKVDAFDMNYVHNNFILKAYPKDAERIQKLEMLDEYEEMNLIQSHYCLVFALQDKQGSFCMKGLS